jgi:hypothetical protein
MSEAYIIQRVLDLEEVRSYRFSGEVHDLNGELQDNIQFTNPVKVVDSSGKMLGFACLYKNQYGATWVDADVFLTRDSPERLDMENLRGYHLMGNFAKIPGHDIWVTYLTLTPGKYNAT